MPLKLEEITPGAVDTFRVESLLNDPAVQYDEPEELFRDGPFVCLEVDGDESLWLEITTQLGKSGKRREILPEWRLNGDRIWQTERQFIHDARKPVRAPNQAFVNASMAGNTVFAHTRARVTLEGVAALLSEVEKYRPQAEIDRCGKQNLHSLFQD